MIELECKDVWFYAPLDETAYYTWIKAIPAVEGIAHRGSADFLLVKSKRISNESLRELLALFYRYRISTRQLAQFLTSRNEHWFASPDKYWFKQVFDGVAAEGKA